MSPCTTCRRRCDSPNGVGYWCQHWYMPLPAQGLPECYEWEAEE